MRDYAPFFWRARADEEHSIGLELTRGVASAGADVAIIFHSAKDAHEVAEKVAKEFGVKCKAYQSDVGDKEKVVATFKQIHDEMGDLIGLVRLLYALVSGPRPTSRPGRQRWCLSRQACRRSDPGGLPLRLRRQRPRRL